MHFLLNLFIVTKNYHDKIKQTTYKIFSITHFSNVQCKPNTQRKPILHCFPSAEFSAESTAKMIPGRDDI